MLLSLWAWKLSRLSLISKYPRMSKQQCHIDQEGLLCWSSVKDMYEWGNMGRRALLIGPLVPFFPKVPFRGRPTPNQQRYEESFKLNLTAERLKSMPSLETFKEGETEIQRLGYKEATWVRPSDFCLIERNHAVFPTGIPSFRKGLWASLINWGATREAESGMSPGNGFGCCFWTQLFIQSQGCHPALNNTRNRDWTLKNKIQWKQCPGMQWKQQIQAFLGILGGLAPLFLRVQNQKMLKSPHIKCWIYICLCTSSCKL